ncbi:MAG: hypothetical protein QOH60_2686 [Mycobacterium sp.]|jgi:deoxyribodipyrimidine photolyase-like uncharacterized protein|nr:hypothetical protein [Mycobacterium sp.]
MSATNDRQALAELAEQSGWQRRQVDRTDFYRRGIREVEVLFTGDKLNGGSLYEDLSLLTHTRDMSMVQSWLTRAL